MSRRRRTGAGVGRQFAEHALWVVGLLLLLLAVLGPRLADRVGWTDADPNDAATSAADVSQSPRPLPPDAEEPLAEFPGEFDATVLVVRDGDSVDVRAPDGRTVRVRLHGIDAPEFAQPHFRGSTAFVRRHLAGRQVRVVPVAIDRYDRLVGEIWLDGRRFNSEIVRQGWAWFYRQYAEGDDELAEAESEARSNARGLWADPSPQPPWVWRRQPGR